MPGQVGEATTQKPHLQSALLSVDQPAMKENMIIVVAKVQGKIRQDS